MITQKVVKKRLRLAEKTLKNLEQREESRIKVSKKGLVNYCKETIVFCNTLLVLMGKK